MRLLRHIPLLACSLALVVALGHAAGCQTPGEPRAWYDEFTDERGLFVHASRRSGGYDLRFATNEADPDHVRLRVRTTRSVHGRTAYFRVDGERFEQPIRARSYTASHATGTRGAVGVTGGGGPGFHSGVGVTLGHGPVRLTTYVTVELPVDFAHQLAEAQSARLRVGEPGGPTYTFSERTRERLARLLDRLENRESADELEPEN